MDFPLTPFPSLLVHVVIECPDTYLVLNINPYLIAIADFRPYSLAIRVKKLLFDKIVRLSNVVSSYKNGFFFSIYAKGSTYYFLLLVI